MQFSNGSTVQVGAIIIEDDLSVERPGFFRAYTAENPDSTIVCTLHGYASGPLFRTVRACADDAVETMPGVPVYRLGRRIR